MTISPYAGKPAEPWMLVNIPKLISAYYTEKPDPQNGLEKVSFGTSGHRGSSLLKSFNEDHILAITYAICLYRKKKNTSGPLFIGMDTHALSEPAFRSALEVLAANEVEVMVSKDGEFTPTPAVSHAILTYNKGRKEGLSDGIVITPSHNPPADGGFKYNPESGGPAPAEATIWIENKANEILLAGINAIKRISFDKAMRADSIHQYDYLNGYISDLSNVIDMVAIRNSGIQIGIDPLGGAGIHYWEPIAKKYGLNLKLANKKIDPDFRFMPIDWDGQIRMDPSSVYAMTNLIGLKDKFDISMACDTDYDRHGIVTRSAGLLPPNHYLAVMIQYLFQHRPAWHPASMVGKTIVSSSMIDRITAKCGRKLYEVPVGFKWFVDGLLNSSIGFCGEESAGASFLRKDGKVWTTDKDGMIAALLAAEITAVSKLDPSQLYAKMTEELGSFYYDRIEAPANSAQKALLAKLDPGQVKEKDLAGDKIISILTTAPGNEASIGGLKITTQGGWFAARPSGTEAIYKIYGESFRSKSHLDQILKEAQKLVDNTLASH